jgi:hypothetical protein
MIAIESAVRTRTIGFIVAATLTGVWATLLSAGTPQSASSHADAAGIFKDRCQVCHGADGSGTTVGKSLQITICVPTKFSNSRTRLYRRRFVKAKTVCLPSEAAWTAPRLENW